MIDPRLKPGLAVRGNSYTVWKLGKTGSALGNGVSEGPDNFLMPENVGITGFNCRKKTQQLLKIINDPDIGKFSSFFAVSFFLNFSKIM